MNHDSSSEWISCITQKQYKSFFQLPFQFPFPLLMGMHFEIGNLLRLGRQWLYGIFNEILINIDCRGYRPLLSLYIPKTNTVNYIAAYPNPSKDSKKSFNWR